MKKPQFIIAAPTSNSGKTTLTLGLLRALENRGMDTQAFKVGPDYIDPKFHKVANGKSSLNLDLYMMTKKELQQQYAYHSNNKQVVCVEGVMGLFDGAKKSEGSTAAVAKELGLPVVLVVNAKSVAYSVAPLLYGFKNFDTEVSIAGVIFNNVNTATHYQFLKEACDDVGVTSFGYVPSMSDCEIPSRHLGLSISDIGGYDSVIQKIAEGLSLSLNLDLLLETTRIPEKKKAKEKVVLKRNLKIAVAQDESFNFSYVQNIESLQQLGTVTFFSPLNDEQLPKADLVYFPGGYPELYTEQLSKNTTMLQSVKQYAEVGGRILAECGGMMYLGKSLIDLKGTTYALVGVFNFTSTLAHKKLYLGYRTQLLGALTLKGHEFHYSKLIEEEKELHIGKCINARGKEVPTKLYQYKNVLASYMHYYLGDSTKIIELFELDSIDNNNLKFKHEDLH